MIRSQRSSTALLDRLPAVRGRLVPYASIKDQTWLRVGGPIEVLFSPKDEEDLKDFLEGCPEAVPLTVIGAASNLLIRDGGVDGVVVRLGPAFGSIAVREKEVEAGAAALDQNIARVAQRAGLSGLEFLSGIPGTLGGALRMNAGAHGGEIGDVFIRASALDRRGKRHVLDHKAMGFAYRMTGAPKDWIFIDAILHGRSDDPKSIEERMKTIRAARSASQPIRQRTGGSTFANPQGYKAWELIDRAGCRGLRLGGAIMSEQHCNFMINDGTATAADLEALGEEVRRRVLETSGIALMWEIKRIGKP